MLDPKIGLLQNLPTFQGFSENQLDLIVTVSAKSFFEAGDNLITKDEFGDTAYLILTGTAKCPGFPGQPPSSYQAGPGALVGEMAMLTETAHSFTVQANERLRAMSIRRDALRQVMLRDPLIAQQISDNLLARFRRLAQELRGLDALLVAAEGQQAELVPPSSIVQIPSPKYFARFSPMPRADTEKQKSFG